MMRLMGTVMGEGARSAIENQVPVGRYARPSEIAATVAWLLSDESTYTTGAHTIAWMNFGLRR
jgi:3-oxoacyl-[acyl-carrier protein] reductase